MLCGGGWCWGSEPLGPKEQRFRGPTCQLPGALSDPSDPTLRPRGRPRLLDCAGT